MHPAFTSMVDYAGLFPPAASAMETAVAEFAAHRQSGDRWMLGRFVVPAARLGELALAVGRLDPAPERDDPWHLSVVLGADLEGDRARIDELAAGRWGEVLRVAAIEARLEAGDLVASVTERVRGAWELFLEVPHLTDYRDLLHRIKAAGAMAKLRTGGVTAEAFPSPLVVVRFLAAAVEAGLPFKATAGLHHPWRGRYPLSHEPGAPTAVMFGFAAVLVATAALRAGADEAVARAILEEEDAAAFRPTDGGLAWRDLQLSAGDLAAARRLAFRSFGSCSFREPVDELAMEVGA